MRISILLLVSIVQISGCSTANLHETFSQNRKSINFHHELVKADACGNSSWWPYLSCGHHFFDCEKSKLENDSRQVVEASNNFQYALMASNVYENGDDVPPRYIILNWEKISRMESDAGLALNVYEKKINIEIVEVAVVYEGTDFTSFSDWKFNLSLTEPKQFTEAQEHLKGIIEEYPNIKITLVGHSLAGGLAINLATIFEGVDAVAFNSSPRAFWGDIDHYINNSRIHLYEKGEVLNSLSRTYLKARLHTDRQLLTVKYNFLKFVTAGKVFSEHSMYKLSRGLLLLAIKAGNKDSINTFVENFPEEYAKGIDSKYCGPIYAKNI